MALLIAIFVLLLISVVAIALIVSSGTETAMVGNYRSSSAVTYAALAGLEEAKGRLSATNPNAFTTTAPLGFVPSPGPLTTDQVRYVLNPAPTENARALLATYPDAEYDLEFGLGSLANATANGNVQTTASVSGVGGVQGPLYKWVRINAVSEQSLNLDVDSDGSASSTTPLYYNATSSSPRFSNDLAAGPQVLEITSLAVLPNGSRKLVQYLVAASGSPLNLSFPSALTLDGRVGTFFPSLSPNFWVNGVDRQGGSGPYPVACPPIDPTRPAVGVIGQGSVNQVIGQIPTMPFNRYPNYPGLGGSQTNPSVGDISSTLIPALQDVNSLEGLVQTIIGSADHVVPASSTPANGLPDSDLGTPSAPVTTVVQGDLSLSGINGYGLLLVTGNLVLDANVSWNGIILVIGQGSLSIPNYGYGQILGAVVLAKTRDSGGNLLSNLGPVTFKVCLTSTCNYPADARNGNRGFWYDSCWIQAALPPAGYKVLSFHEISQ